jgi:hypothetical protein
LRFVFAKSSSCFSDMDSAIFFDAPCRLDFLLSPRFAASAAPAAICCFFDLAGILFNRRAGKKRMYSHDSKQNHLWNRCNLRFTSHLNLMLEATR